MGKYMVTYVSDSFNAVERKRFFQIDFKSKDGKDQFQLYPDLIKGNKGMEGYSANPSSKHYWYKDIFVYISAYQENNKVDTATYRNREIKVGDTMYYSNGFMILNRVLKSPDSLRNKFAADELSVFLDFTIISKEGKRYAAAPGIAIKGESLRQIPDTVISQSLALRFNKVVDQNTGKLEIGIKESGAITDLVTLKVYEFPMINVLWIGVIVMTLGLGMSIYQRLLKKS